MGLRIYITISERYTEHTQLIGMLIISYIHQRTGIYPHTSHYREDFREHIVITGDNEIQTRRIYDNMNLERGRGVFQEIDLRESYHYIGKPLVHSNGNLWHDRLYDTAEMIVRYSIERNREGLGHRDEVSEIVTALIR